MRRMPREHVKIPYSLEVHDMMKASSCCKWFSLTVLGPYTCCLADPSVVWWADEHTHHIWPRPRLLHSLCENHKSSPARCTGAWGTQGKLPGSCFLFKKWLHHSDQAMVYCLLHEWFVVSDSDLEHTWRQAAFRRQRDAVNSDSSIFKVPNCCHYQDLHDERSRMR